MQTPAVISLFFPTFDIQMHVIQNFHFINEFGPERFKIPNSNRQCGLTKANCRPA